MADAARAPLTAWAARGLGGTQRGLETAARWLDERAKRAADLKAKLDAAPAQG